jgi:cysteinyl-tRNA synthetase
MVERWRDVVTKAGPSLVGVDAATTIDPATLPAGAKQACSAFAAAMNDDLNVAGAIGAINSWLNRVGPPSAGDAAALVLMDRVLGVVGLVMAPGNLGNPGSPDIPPGMGGERSAEDLHIDDLVRRRTEARKGKNWAEADRIRDELNRLNVVVEDTPSGPKWSRRASL